MATLGSPRRYYLAKRHVSADLCDNLEWVWRHKQEAEPGTPLPADFILLSRLTEQGYTTEEDLDGADEEELQDRGFTSRETAEVLKAYAAL